MGLFKLYDRIRIWGGLYAEFKDVGVHLEEPAAVLVAFADTESAQLMFDGDKHCQMTRDTGPDRLMQQRGCVVRTSDRKRRTSQNKPPHLFQPAESLHRDEMFVYGVFARCAGLLHPRPLNGRLRLIAVIATGVYRVVHQISQAVCGRTPGTPRRYRSLGGNWLSPLFISS